MGRATPLAHKLWNGLLVLRPDQCWPWLLARHPKGYGMLGHAGRILYIHRVAYLLHHGDIPTGLQVLHHCNNPPCGNPSHLYAGTNCDNVADRVAAGSLAGENHPNAKLTAADVRQIRSLYASGECTQLSLAKKFGVRDSTVCLIVNKKLWPRLQGRSVIPTVSQVLEIPEHL